MSADNHSGPRMAAAAPTHSQALRSRAGAYQFPELDGTGAVLDLSAWAQPSPEYVEIVWYPAADDPEDEYDEGDGMLLYGFFATKALAAAGFDAVTASTPDGDDAIGTVREDGTVVGKIANAPSRLDRGERQMTVPRSHPWLRIEAAHGMGLCVVRHAEG